MTDDAILKPLITLIVPDRPRPRRPPDSLWAQVAKMEGEAKLFMASCTHLSNSHPELLSEIYRYSFPGSEHEFSDRTICTQGILDLDLNHLRVIHFVAAKDLDPP